MTFNLSEKIGIFDIEKVNNNLLWSEDVKQFIKELKEVFGDNYFDSIYSSNRYWVMGKEKMTDEKFQDILTLILNDFKKKLDKLVGNELK